ncbi:MAG: tripartite tricarboxylate transporter TctB family protein, partial [Candidatus Rokuibacteriota bacterium]
MKGDIISSLVGVFVGIGVIVESLELRIGTPTNPEPGFFPFLGGVTLVTLSSLLLAQACLGRSTGCEAFGDLRRPAILVVAMGAYVVILEPLGYVLATVPIAVVVLRVLGVRSWHRLGVISVGLSVSTYVLFAR